MTHLSGISAEPRQRQPVLVTVEHQKRIFCATTGVDFDLAKVQHGRQRELHNIERFGVRTVITPSEAKQRGPQLGWLGDTKAVDGDPTAVRWRLVATEINSDAREDVSQSAPPTKCSGLILSLASSSTGSSGQQDRLVARCEMMVAFFHALASGKIAVIPPKGLVEGVCCWFLQKAMYGTREASKCWRNNVIDTLTAASCASSQVVPMTFHHETHGFFTPCYGDDLFAEGSAVWTECWARRLM